MKLNSVKSRASDTIDRVADVIHYGQDTLSDTTKHVGEDVARAATRVIRGASMSGFGEQLATVGKMVAAVASAKALVAAIAPGDPVQMILGVMNLQRRPSRLTRAALGMGYVVVGAAFGVGTALLLTPKTGPQLRAMIRDGIKDARTEAVRAAESLGTKAHHAVDRVESRVRDVAHDVDVEVESRAWGMVGDAHSDGARFAGTTDYSPARPRLPSL